VEINEKEGDVSLLLLLGKTELDMEAVDVFG
jgi:hypothetical protein